MNFDGFFFGYSSNGKQLEAQSQPQPSHPSIGGDATAMMMAAAKLASSATGPATKVDDVIDDIKKKQSIRSEADEQMNIGAAAHKTEITAKQRWNWAFNKIVLQLNVSRIFRFTNIIHAMRGLKFKFYFHLFL